MHTSEIAIKLNAKSVGDDRWVAACPAHKSNRGKKGLLIKGGDDGKTWLCCDAACSLDQILEAAGLQWRDLFSTPDPSQEEIAKFQSRNKQIAAKRGRQIVRCESASDAMKEASLALYDLRARIPKDVLLLDDFDNSIQLVAAARLTISLLRERL